MRIENLTYPGLAPENDDLILITHENGSTEQYHFRHPVTETPQPETYLHMFYPESVTVGETVTIGIICSFADGTHVPTNSTYRVPIMRASDNKQIDYLKAVFVEGVAEVSFIASEVGKMVMDVNQIDPLPTSIVVDNPVIFVDNVVI